MKSTRLWLVAVVVSVIGTSAGGVATPLPVEGRMPSLGRADGWLNSQPLSTPDLRGKVVVVDFWTYTCINWRRTAPYVRAWAQKYKDQGLVVIGVHTPEFSFEKNVDNIRRAAKEQGVEYPIAIDSDYGIWDAFNNRYWPALYFIDAQGRIRHHQFGEGEYEQSEAVIQQLLAESGHDTFERAPVAADAHGPELGADWKNLGSPETYVGYRRSDSFASPREALLDRSRVYAVTAQLKLNEWGFAGDWTMVNRANGKISYRFHARDLHLVMGPAVPGTAVRFRVLIDGHPPGASHGVDVDDMGQGRLDEPRMYQLIRQPAPIADQLFEIEFLDPGADVFVFTFG
jgi:thiol-disulfide isomerase/thioredoxin